MGYEPHGKHLIAGDWVSNQSTFTSQPVANDGQAFSEGGADEVDRAVRAAEEAFATYGWTSRADRAALLEAIAEEIDARGDDITRLGCAETGLPEARLQGERGRTTGQLRLFAEHIRDGAYLDRRHDAALPDRQPLPRPDLKMVQRPIGPVAVFGASNFPLRFRRPVEIPRPRLPPGVRLWSKVTPPILPPARSWLMPSRRRLRAAACRRVRFR